MWLLYWEWIAAYHNEKLRRDCTRFGPTSETQLPIHLPETDQKRQKKSGLFEQSLIQFPLMTSDCRFYLHAVFSMIMDQLARF